MELFSTKILIGFTFPCCEGLSSSKCCSLQEFEFDIYRAFHGFGQAEFSYDGLVLGSS